MYSKPFTPDDPSASTAPLRSIGGCYLVRTEVTRNLKAEANLMRSREHRRTAIASQSFGALALGAIAMGALAVGALAIGKLAIGRARIRRLEIDELVVRQLCVTDELHVPSNPDPER
jgi:hypothetical protein